MNLYEIELQCEMQIHPQKYVIACNGLKQDQAVTIVRDMEKHGHGLDGCTVEVLNCKKLNDDKTISWKVFKVN